MAQYISQRFLTNERNPPFFFRQPLHTHTHLDFYSGIKIHPTALFTREKTAFLFFFLGGRQAKGKKPSTISTPLLAPIGRATFSSVSSLCAFFSLKNFLIFYLSSLIILGWGGAPAAMLALQDEWGGGNLIIWLSGWFIVGEVFTAQNQS